MARNRRHDFSQSISTAKAESLPELQVTSVHASANPAARRALKDYCCIRFHSPESYEMGRSQNQCLLTYCFHRTNRTLFATTRMIYTQPRAGLPLANKASAPEPNKVNST